MIVPFPLAYIERERQRRFFFAGEGIADRAAAVNCDPLTVPSAAETKKGGLNDMSVQTPNDSIAQPSLIEEAFSQIARSQQVVAELNRPCTTCRHPRGAHDGGGCSTRMALYEMDGSVRETDWCRCTSTCGAKFDVKSALARAIAVGRVEMYRVTDDMETWYGLTGTASCALCDEHVRSEGYAFYSPITNAWTFADLMCVQYAQETGEAR